MRRTFERRVARWKTLHGPVKNVVIEQVHKPGQLAASDFTVCNSLKVTIATAAFDHTLFHCVLTYSNFESITLCHSESFEALSTGIQDAFFRFGGVPMIHRTDSLAAAIRNHSSKKQLTDRYQALMTHYGCQAHRTNARCANENGDVESLNGKIKDRIDQALRIRGSRDFASVQAYVEFLDSIVDRANHNRTMKFQKDQAALNPLPAVRLESDDYVKDLSVSKGSTIRVRSQVYSVPSRLIDSKVNARVTIDSIIVSVGDDVVETMPRLVGKKAEAINYRHIIDSLVRKPGAFKNYRYHEQMFPRTVFRIAYDVLGENHTERVQSRIYLSILHIAARQSEEATAQALTHLIDQDLPIEVDQVRYLVEKADELPCPTDVEVPDIDLTDFDELIYGSDNTNDKECQNGANESDDKDDNEEAIQTGFEDPGGEGPGEARSDACRSVPGAPPAELSGSLRVIGGEGGAGRSLAHGVPLGADEPGDRGSSGGPCATINDTFETSSGQDMVELRLRSSAAAGDTQAGDTSVGEVLGSTRKRAAIREARQREESRALCVGGAVDSSGSQHLVHDLQPVGSTTSVGQARAPSSTTAQDTLGLRSFDHRRPGIRATEPRGDGSLVYPVGRTLRAWERATDEQPCVQQMGPNLQGRDDDSGRDRSVSSPQRDHRDERGQLPRGSSQEEQSRIVNVQLAFSYDFFSGEF
jgi:hypothetical protein